VSNHPSPTDIGASRLIFLHVPKVGGTTLASVLRARFPVGQTYLIDGRCLAESMEEFRRLPPDRRAQIRFLHGHMPFGLHEYLPEPSVYVTMLRHPVQRILSYYFYVKRFEEHPHHQAASEMDLRGFACSEISTELDNGQVRLLSGEWHRGIPFGKCTPDLLEEAIDNLVKHFIVVGLTERFDESLLLMRKALGWRGYPLYTKKNVTAGRLQLNTIPPDILETIAQQNQLDMKLYEHVQASFERELEDRCIDAATLRSYGRRLGLYQRLAPLGRAMPAPLRRLAGRGLRGL
jgi:hypothetical protein